MTKGNCMFANWRELESWGVWRMAAVPNLEALAAPGAARGGGRRGGSAPAPSADAAQSASAPPYSSIDSQNTDRTASAISEVVVEHSHVSRTRRRILGCRRSRPKTHFPYATLRLPQAAPEDAGVAVNDCAEAAAAPPPGPVAAAAAAAEQPPPATKRARRQSAAQVRGTMYDGFNMTTAARSGARYDVRWV